MHQAGERDVAGGFEVDSCGLGSWHVGNPADPRMIEVARRRGVAITSRARQVRAPEDFESFDLLVAMDRSNLEGLVDRGCPRERVVLLREFDAEERGGDVPDPYYGGPEGFDEVFEIVERSTSGLLGALLSAGR